MNRGRLLERLSPKTFFGAVAVLATLTAAGVLLASVAYHRAGPSGVIGVLVAAPFLAILAAPSLVALFPLYVAWVDERTWAPWQGRYYAFDDRQIRVAEARGDVWFAIDDVHDAVAMPLRPHVLAGFDVRERTRTEFGDALSVAGLKRLLGKRTDTTSLRFLRWAEHDVRTQWRKRRERDATLHPHRPTDAAS